MKMSGRLKILHVIDAITPTNSQYNEHCLPVMDQRDITICTFFKSSITPPPAITLFDGDSSLIGFFRSIQAALKAKDYDVIHVHTPHMGLLLLLTFYLTGQPRKLIAQTVQTVHNCYQNFKFRHKLFFLPGFALFRRIVYCSYSSHDSFPTIYRWLAKGKMHVVQNGVDLDRIDHAVTTSDAQEGPYTITTVGMIPLKNPFTVLEAFNRSKDEKSRLVYLGDGKLRTSLISEINNRGLQEQVLLTGMLPRDSAFKWFIQSDLFVSASHGEGLPVAVLEAMACRCPVILSDIPPHREIAGDASFIPLVHPDDAAGFARLIQRYREMPVEERALIGQECRKLIEKQFSLPVMHRGYAEVYSQIIQRPAISILEGI